MTPRGVLCGLLLARHRPERTLTGGWRCKDCGKPGTNALELLGEDVALGKRTRGGRYRGRGETVRPGGRP